MGQFVFAAEKRMKRLKKKLKELKEAYEAAKIVDTESRNAYLDQISKYKAQLKYLKEELKAANKLTRKRYRSYQEALQNWRDNQEAPPSQPNDLHHPEDDHIDNLKEVKGIGPKTEALLRHSGIQTFRQLSETSTDELEAILEAAGVRYNNRKLDSWVTQANQLYLGY
ncbi:MAG: DUF4332 domain-containing protein [Bacteroidota bacterium]